mmetsp:Transcript_37933/g.62922  ORF Transcript_37933/g.62922 Transcript_37933/m.62922 type:complete len:120 (+) Transcript_37933:234-593(+)
MPFFYPILHNTSCNPLTLLIPIVPPVSFPKAPFPLCHHCPHMPIPRCFSLPQLTRAFTILKTPPYPICITAFPVCIPVPPLCIPIPIQPSNKLGPTHRTPPKLQSSAYRQCIAGPLSTA